MLPLQYTGEEIRERGQQWYDQKLRPLLGMPENIGKIVVIDIETGDYEIDSVGLTANKRALARHPTGTFYGVRVGYEAVESLGGGLRCNSITSSGMFDL